MRPTEVTLDDEYLGVDAPVSSPPDFLDAALRVAARGFRVFPITPGDKKPPLISEWQLRASSDPEQIQAWWLKWPTANIGLVADDLLVVDVDPRNGGDKGLEGLEALNGALPATGPAVRTGGGGVHIYFRSPGVPLSSSTSKVANGVDIKTGLGYVVLPPSVTTGPYEWIRDLEQELPEVPSWLLERLARGKTEKFTVPTEVTPGSRNDTLWKLGRSLKAKGLPAGAIGAAVIATNQDFKPPLEDAEVELLIANVLSQPDRADFTPPDTSQPDQPDITPPAPTSWSWATVVRGKAITDTPITAPDFLVTGLFTRNRQHAIIGASGSMKSWVMFDLCVGVACPEVSTFLGQPIAIHGPVVLESWEQGDQEDRRRLQLLLRGHGYTEAPDNLILASEPALTLNDEGAYQARLRDLTEARVVLYAFDSLSEGSGIELNDNTAYTAWWRARVRPMLSAGITVVFTHLRGHVQNKPGALADRDAVFRGATQIRALTQAAVECRQLTENSSQLRHNKHRDTTDLPFGTLNLVGGWDTPEVRLSLVAPIAKDVVRMAELRKLLFWLEARPGSSKNKIKLGLGFGQDKVYSLIDDAARLGWITSLGAGKREIWTASPDWRVKSESSEGNPNEESED
jgi:hypothetical protein